MAEDHTPPTQTHVFTGPDHPRAGQDSFTEKIRRSSLNWAGRSFVAADLALISSGLMSKRYREAAGGFLWLAGGAVLARYGSGGQEQNLQKLRCDLSGYLKKEGIDIPEQGNISLEVIASHSGLIHKIEDFIYNNPSQVANAIYAYGGSQMLRSGLTHKKFGDSLSGAAVTAGALAGLLVPQSKEPLPRTGNVPSDTWNAIRERPLRLTGMLYMISPFALAKSGMDEFRANPRDKSYVFKLIAAAGNFIANSLITISSKNSDDHADKDQAQKVYTEAAKIIAGQPKEIRDSIIDHVAGFLGAQSDVDLTTKQAELMLRKTIDKMVMAQEIDQKYQQSWQERTAPPESGLAPSLT